jgi:hypothetical protein
MKDFDKNILIYFQVKITLYYNTKQIKTVKRKRKEMDKI